MIVIRLADIIEGGIHEESFRKIKLSENELDKYLLDKDDVLCIRVNESEKLVGRMIVCNTHRKWAFSDHLISYRPIKEIILSKYLSEYFNTDQVRKYIRFNKVSSAGQNTISQDTLAEIPLTLPSILEQKRILDILENQHSLLNNSLLLIKKCSRMNSQLKNSILQKAFVGQLVSQDPNDEPAEILLQKIKQH